MQIQPGDYVAVSDITCEAIHAAVVKCFEAAGGIKKLKYGNYHTHMDILTIDGSRDIVWGVSDWPYLKRQLTLQQLFTATNSISWPSWAVDIRIDTECIYFTDAVSKFQMLIAPRLNKADWAGDGISKNLSGTVLAVRPCNLISDSTIRPAPELHWYDWSADRARELPPVGEVVEYTAKEITHGNAIKPGQWYHGIIIAYHDGYVWTSDNGIRLLSNTKFRPANYEQRKADLERDKIVAKASQLMCEVIKKGMKPDESYYGQYALALYDAGMLQEPRS